MAPAGSKLRAEAGLGALWRRALARYLLLLRLYPVLTKAATSGVLSALGNFLAQMIEKKQKKENCSQNLDGSGPLRYAIYGFFFTGPLSHFFYLFMEHWIPPDVPLAGVKRLLLDRLIFAPAFLWLFFFVMNVLEDSKGNTTALIAVLERVPKLKGGLGAGVSAQLPKGRTSKATIVIFSSERKDMAAFSAKLRRGFWLALQMNWKVWTPLQFININYVPLQFRVLFANLVALFWYAYLASLGK